MPGDFSLYHFWQVATHRGTPSTSAVWSRKAALEITQIKLGIEKEKGTKREEFEKWKRGERRPDPQQNSFLHLLFVTELCCYTLAMDRVWACQRNIWKWEKQLMYLTANKTFETAGMSPAPSRETGILSEMLKLTMCKVLKWDSFSKITAVA